MANDGIVNQAAVYAYASHSFETLRQLDRWGVRFEKGRDRRLCGEEGPPHGRLRAADAGRHDIKKVLYRQLKRARIPIANRLVCTRLLTDAEGAVNGVLGFDCRSGDFHVIRAKAVIACCGAAGRPGPAVLGLPDGVPTRTRPTPATATPWPIMPAPSWPTWNASRSTR
ncbi:FAD-binding protein [Pseudomonas aeruginosa]|nr:FAD-binding protein [Pseudomonas aeruginosa]